MDFNGGCICKCVLGNVCEWCTGMPMARVDLPRRLVEWLLKTQGDLAPKAIPEGMSHNNGDGVWVSVCVWLWKCCAYSLCKIVRLDQPLYVTGC